MVYEAQNEIIRMQSEVIEELQKELMMYMAAEEIEKIPCVQKLHDAKQLKSSICGGE